ncbi:hypothetical protein Tco_1057951 [Tanacetum coccineum]|uniref:Uncharacterized protein n=1 Tax=Tanacetum coccineum TaxID=301880 RepID=A0ABQ5H885_9ASTR
MKQVDRYAKAISSIPTIVERYISNKLGEAIQKSIKSHTAECREEALADKREYIDLIDTSVRAIIKEEVKTQLPQILPQAVSDFATAVIERNVTESLEAAFLAKYSSQPKSTYAVAASLSEFELTKILMDKMEEHKSYLIAEYKKELYDALVKSYNTNKDLFETYGEVFTLKRSQDDKDKDQDPSARSDQGMKRRKSSKYAESSRDPKSKKSKSSSSSKGTSRSQHKSSGKSAHTEEPSYTVDDSGVQQNQEFDTGKNDEQPDDEAASKVDFRLPQTWISDIARAKRPPTSFDELMDTPIDFFAFVMDWLNITNLTQELLVGPAFNLLNVTSLHKDPLFDELHDDTLDYMGTEDAQDVGRTRDVVNKEKENAEDAVSTEGVVSTDKEKVSTDRPNVITDRPKVNTDKEKDSTVSHDEDDETIAQVLLNTSQAKLVSREKEKGVELKDVEETERPRPTSTRSLLTLKPLPKIDPKDKGKKKIKEEDESDTESEGILEAEKKFKQVARDEEMDRKVQEDWEAEEEVKKL